MDNHFCSELAFVRVVLPVRPCVDRLPQICTSRLFKQWWWAEIVVSARSRVDTVWTCAPETWHYHADQCHQEYLPAWKRHRIL